jgi:hypothetical protein
MLAPWVMHNRRITTDQPIDQKRMSTIDKIEIRSSYVNVCTAAPGSDMSRQGLP